MASAHSGFLSSVIFLRHGKRRATCRARHVGLLCSFLALRLGQGLVNRCNQLSQILWGGFMYDIEQIRPLFVFIAKVGEEKGVYETQPDGST